MEKDILRHPRTIAVLLELGWGDRFESDLEARTDAIKGEWDLSFDEIREALIQKDLVYRLRGGRGSPYLALTDEGQQLAGDLRSKKES